MGQQSKVPRICMAVIRRSWSVANTARHLFGTYGFDCIENACNRAGRHLVHGIGESTDVVRKEITVYFPARFLKTFQLREERGLKACRCMAMRPEGTAGVVRKCRA